MNIKGAFFSYQRDVELRIYIIFIYFRFPFHSIMADDDSMSDDEQLDVNISSFFSINLIDCLWDRYRIIRNISHRFD